MNNNTTIVTVCDKGFIWAAYLLIASLRYNNVNAPVHVLGRDFTNKDAELLEQFGDVKIIETSDKRPAMLLKPEAILTADTEYIIWIDADCIVTGDVTKYLVASGESFQIPLRTEEQTERLYRTYFGTLGEDERIPKVVLKTWKTDVGENDSPAIETTCMTYCFMLHRKYLDFIKKWHSQILKVVNKAYNFVGILDKESLAYHMADESVLNSLFAFAHDAPTMVPISEYLRDKTLHSYLVHFSNIPKPWTMWRLEHMKYFDAVTATIEWTQNKGYKTLPIPWSLKRKNKLICYSLAYIYKFAEKIRNRLRRKIYKP